MLVSPTTAVGAAVALPREAESAEPVQGAVLPPANGANAPADQPADADTLSVRALRRRLARRGDESAAARRDAESSDATAAPASRGSSRGTPGISQPGSVIAASRRP